MFDRPKELCVCMRLWMHAFVCELESMLCSFCVHACVCMYGTSIHSSIVHLAHTLSIPLSLIECISRDLTVHAASQQPIRTINYSILTLWWFGTCGFSYSEKMTAERRWNCSTTLSEMLLVSPYSPLLDMSKHQSLRRVLKVIPVTCCEWIYKI